MGEATPVTNARRVRLEHDERRDDILAAAQTLFAHRSYESISTAEVADAAGTTRTNLHYYFGTKRKLYLEVVRQFAELKLPRVATAGRPLEVNASAVFAQWLDLVEANAETYLVLASAHTTPQDAEIDSVLQRSQRAWENRLLRLIDAPGPESRARAAVRSFQAMIGTACVQWLREQTLTKADVHDLLTHGLLTISYRLRATSDQTLEPA